MKKPTKNSMNIKNLLESTISSKYGIYFHVTTSDFSKVMNKKFEAGFRGGIVGYGEGWYFYNRLEDAKKGVGNYLGKNIIKARVNHKKVLFVDSEEAFKEADKIHGGHDLHTQLKSLGVTQDLINQIENKEKPSYPRLNVATQTKIRKYIEGVMYGKRGIFLVIFKNKSVMNSIIPYTISKDGGKTWEKLSGNEYRKRAFKLSQRRENIKPTKK